MGHFRQYKNVVIVVKKIFQILESKREKNRSIFSFVFFFLLVNSNEKEYSDCNSEI